MLDQNGLGGAECVIQDLCEEEYAEMEYCCHSEIALVSFGHCLSVPGSFSLLRREGCEAFNAV